MSSAYYVCCMYSNARQTTFAIEANAMNSDQTVPKAVHVQLTQVNWCDYFSGT